MFQIRAGLRINENFLSGFGKTSNSYIGLWSGIIWPSRRIVFKRKRRFQLLRCGCKCRLIGNEQSSRFSFKPQHSSVIQASPTNKIGLKIQNFTVWSTHPFHLLYKNEINSICTQTRRPRRFILGKKMSKDQWAGQSTKSLFLCA